ncbi:MAG: cysteine desulfurase-like protein [Caulobacteraceae bacterium]
MHFDVQYIREQFPAMKRIVNGHPAAYLDGPGGVQIPQRVIDKASGYLANHNANIHGAFATSMETDRMIVEARKAFADFFGCSWEEVSFGANSTTINFNLAHALARGMKPGDEIIITDIDHEANRGPWEILEERGIIIKNVKVDLEKCIVDMDDFAAKLTHKTKVAAFNYASNAVGTISDVKKMVRMAHEAGALTVVDCVHYALHGAIDVKDIDTDFLFCSAYKFFGPHVGVLYAKKDRMEALRTVKVGEQEDWAPLKFETGTLNHEGIAGAAEAVEFIADIGAKYEADFADRLKGLEGRRRNIVAGMLSLEAYEQPIADYLIEELKKIPGVKVYGPPKGHPRTSTVSFTLKGKTPRQVAECLADKGLFVWDGDFFATKLVKVFGLRESGGLIRIGLAPYNTMEEIQRAIDAIKELA